MANAKPLTRREKAALTLAALYEVQGLYLSWLDVYLIAIDRPTNDVFVTVALKSRAASWKNSAKVQDFFRVEAQRLRAWVANANNGGKEKEEEESGNNNDGVAAETEKKCKPKIDYTNKEVALAELNRLAAAAKDDKTKLDIMKLIGDFQQFRQAPGGEEEEIRRFYMPLRCNDCQLYIDARQALYGGGE